MKSINLNVFFELWNFLNLGRKSQLIMLLLLSLFAVISEMLSLGSIVPFLAVIVDTGMVFNHPDMQVIINFFDINSLEETRLFVTTAFIFFAIVASAIKLLFFYLMTNITFGIGVDLSVEVLNKSIHQSYSVQISRNSSEIISVITRKIEMVVGHVLMPLLTLLSSTSIIIGIVAVMLYIDTILTVLIFCSLAFIYLSLSYVVKNNLNKNSEHISVSDIKVIKTLQESFGSIRDVILSKKQSYFLHIFKDSQEQLKNAQAQNYFISNSPRYIIEGLGVVLIAVVSYMMSTDPEYIDIIIPTIGALALGLQRLLPLAQSVYSSISNLYGSYDSFNEVMGFLQQKMLVEDHKGLVHFEKKITLKDVSFRYSSDSPWVLRNVNITINKGMCIGVVGSTGGGKSTLVDIIMGLLQVTEGSLIVDKTIVTSKNNQGWQKNITHIPQHVYLTDGTIVDNIAFGEDSDSIDFPRIQKAAYQANILDLIESWPNKYQTIVGENGIFLSGGQRQRIGIARALYNNFNIIVLDEATSSLDNETERVVIKNIEKLKHNTTIIMIAHRLSTLEKCDLILSLNHGKIKQEKVKIQ